MQCLLTISYYKQAGHYQNKFFKSYIINFMAQDQTEEKVQPQAAPKKKSKGFIIVLVLLVVGGGWFGLTKYFHGQHHEETDDAQIEANISPVISKIPGYVTKV